jgi:hypothetical protein
MTNLVTDDLETFEADIDSGLSELRSLAVRWVQIIVDLGRPFFEIHRRKLYKRNCDSWNDYCTNRFGMEGDRCRRLADAYEVGRTISASAGIDGTKDPTLMLEYLASMGFSEFLARNLKHVPPEQQATVFSQARQLADGGIVTGKMIDAAATQATTTPLELASMSESEQREEIKAAEGRLGPAWDRERCMDWVRTILKRNRSPLELAKDLPLSEAERPIAEKQRELVAMCEALCSHPEA